MTYQQPIESWSESTVESEISRIRLEQPRFYELTSRLYAQEHKDDEAGLKRAVLDAFYRSMQDTQVMPASED